MADDDRDPAKGIWLDQNKPLDHYLLRSGASLFYQDVRRILVVKMLDQSKKSVEVNDAQTVSQMMETICKKLGISNFDEYSLAREISKEQVKFQQETMMRSMSGMRSVSGSNLKNGSTLMNNGTMNGTMRGSSKSGTLRDGSSTTMNQSMSSMSGLNTLQRGGTNGSSSTILSDKTKSKDNKLMTTLLRSETERKYAKYHESIITDENLNWLNPAQTLREQGIFDNEELMLRRRYFYSDQYIEKSDPKQLKLLYEQCREGIIGGTQPITEETAIQLGALQLFIQYEAYKNNQTALDAKWSLKDTVPSDLAKSKGLQKKILDCYKKQDTKMSRFDAMSNYVNRCRKLETYGVTFFLVKERQRGKSKLLPKLFGVSKSSCISVDPKTKKTDQTWQLEHIKKWAASNNSFILDFGEHHPMYAIQTVDGEQIAQLIAGYIEIILKNRQMQDRFQNAYEGEEGKIQQGEVKSGKGTAVKRGGRKANKGKASNTGISTHGGISTSPGVFTEGEINGQQGKSSFVPGQRQNAVVEPFIAIINEARQNMKNQENNPDSTQTKNTLVSSHHRIMTHTCGILMPVPELLTSSDRDAQAKCLNEMTSNLNGLSQASRDMARFWGDDDDNSRNLLRAAEDVMNALQDLITATYSANDDKNKNQMFPEANKLAKAAQALLDVIGANEHPDFSENLEWHAKNVATKTALLVNAAKSVASDCKDGEGQNSVITAATTCALDTSKLVTIVRSVAPIAEHQDVYEPCKHASDQVQISVEKCKVNSLAAVGENSTSYHGLKQAAKDVSDALQELLNAIKRGPLDEHNNQLDQAANGLINDPDNLPSHAKSLSSATMNLVNLLKREANQETDQRRHDLLVLSAKGLADATGQMVLAAQNRYKNPEDPDALKLLRNAANDLKSAAAKADQARTALASQLVQAANHAAICSSQLTTCAKSNLFELDEEKRTNPVGRALFDACADLIKETSVLVEKMRDCKLAYEHVQVSQDGPQLGAAKSQERKTTSDLCDVAEGSFQTTGIRGVQCSRAIMNIVKKEAGSAKAAHLETSSKRLANALDKLHDQVEEVRRLSPIADAASALQIIKDLDIEMEQVVHNIENHDEDSNRGLATVEMSNASKLGLDGREVARAIATLISAASRGNAEHTAQGSQETAHALRSMVNTVRGLNLNSELKLELAKTTREMLLQTGELIEAAQNALHAPQDRESQQRLAYIGKAVSQSIHACIKFTPGQKELENMQSKLTVQNVEQVLNSDLSNRTVPITCQQLRQDTQNLGNAVINLKNLPENPETDLLVDKMEEVTNANLQLLNTGSAYISQNKLPKNHLVYKNLKLSADCTNKLLNAAKSFATDTSSSSSRNKLYEAAKGVTESVNSLLIEVSDASIGERKCEQLTMGLENIIPKTADSPAENFQGEDSSYFNSLHELKLSKNKLTSQLLPNLEKSIIHTDINHFSTSLDQIETCVKTQIVPRAIHCAYLIGCDDPGTIKPTPGVIDAKVFNKAQNDIQEACSLMINCTQPGSNVTQQELFKATAVIAKNTTDLCTACKNASQQAQTAKAKRHFVNAAKEVANQTTQLVRAIKNLDPSGGDSGSNNRHDLAAVAEPLSEAFNNLYNFATDPEYAGKPAEFSQAAIEQQKMVLSPLERHVEALIEVVNVSKTLIAGGVKLLPGEPVLQEYKANSQLCERYLNEVIVAIGENAPGQTDCDSALKQLRAKIEETNTVLMQVMVGEEIGANSSK